MGIVMEELERMGRIATSPYFSLGLAAFSMALGLFSVFGFVMGFFVSIFLEALAWLVAVLASVSAGFAATHGKPGDLQSAMVKGAKAMVAANVPRYFLYVAFFLLSGLALFGGTYGQYLQLAILNVLLILFIILMVNAFLGMIFGAIGGYLGGSKTAAFIRQRMPTRPQKAKVKEPFFKD